MPNSMIDDLKKSIRNITRVQKVDNFNKLFQALMSSDFGDKYEDVMEQDEIKKLIEENNIEIVYGEKPKNIPKEIVTVLEKNSNITTYSEGGRGKKQCPECKQFVGAVSHTCACGHVFVKSAVQKEVVVEQQKTAGRYKGSMTTIAIPAGFCPVKLNSTEKDKIIEWAGKIREIYSEKNQHLSLEGLVYFIRQFFDYGSDNFKLIAEELTQAESAHLI